MIAFGADRLESSRLQSLFKMFKQHAHPVAGYQPGIAECRYADRDVDTQAHDVYDAIRECQVNLQRRVFCKQPGESPA
jgi:hypothetical protein